MKSVAGGTTTYFVNEMVEWKGAINTMVQDCLRQFFSLGGRKIAVSAAARTGFGIGGTLNWLIGDHLGSTVVTANMNGTSTGEQWYKAFGETRGTGLVGTKYQFQGQFAYNGTGEIGLQYFRARFFDPQLGRFASADSIIPGAGNPLAWDRYAGMANNAVRYTDPSGHKACDGPQENDCNGRSPDYNHPTGWKFSHTEMFLLTVAILAETSSGKLPDEWARIIVWTYLNRVGTSHRNIIDAIKNEQSALSAYHGKDGLLPMHKDETWDQYAKRLESWKNKDDAWNHIEDLVKKEIARWERFGSNSSADPAHGLNDFRIKKPEEVLRQHVPEGQDPEEYVAANSYETGSETYKTWNEKVPGFSYFILGPYDSSWFGQELWIFVSNKISTIHE